MAILKSKLSLEDFAASVAQPVVPDHFSPALRALWFLKKGDWEKAHECAQKDEGPDGSWVHALLHRIEGDEANADYWYGQAGKKKPDVSTDQEWSEITRDLLGGRHEF